MKDLGPSPALFSLIFLGAWKYGKQISSDLHKLTLVVTKLEVITENLTKKIDRVDDLEKDVHDIRREISQ